MTYKENFLTKAKLLYNDYYNYSKVIYVNQHTSVVIDCPVHGEFIVTPHAHLHQNRSCYLCKKEEKELTLKRFIIRAQYIHGNKYDYSKSILINRETHLIVTCPLHGDWLTTPANHLNINKFGCPKCGKESSANKRRKTTEQRKAEASFKHKNKYDYSKAVYTTAHSKLIVICKEHGEWAVTASNHSNNGSGCPICAQISRSFSSFENFIEEYLILNSYIYERRSEEHTFELQSH